VKNPDPENLKDWMAGADAHCPYCGDWVLEGDDCEDQHWFKHNREHSG